MFGRDPITPLTSLVTPTVRYFGTDENIVSLEALKNMYQLIASNLEHSRKKRNTKSPVPDRKLNDSDSVLLKYHTTGVWDPRYTAHHHIVPFPIRTQVEVVDSKGKVKIVHISDIKYVLPADRVLSNCLITSPLEGNQN